MPDLTLVPTSELIDELVLRFPHLVVVGLRFKPIPADIDAPLGCNTAPLCVCEGNYAITLPLVQAVSKTCETQLARFVSTQLELNDPITPGSAEEG